MTQEEVVDVLVAGTGAAGLCAAIAAADAGAKVLVVESADRWGGTTMRSGGGLWLPDNPVMRRAGIADSRAEALTYLKAAIGDVGPASSTARREVFVDTVDELVTTLERHGVRWSAAKKYPDYYPERPGGKIGRSIEPRPYDTKRLGSWIEQSRVKDGVPLAVLNDDFYELNRAWSTPSGFVRGARLVFRVLGGLVTGKRQVGMGAALACSLMEIVRQQGTEVRLGTPLAELLVEDGAVVGAVVGPPEDRRAVRARGGVVLGAGGFAHRTEWRQKHHGVPGWSAASQDDQGTAIEAGARAGGALALMDDAWWGAGVDTRGAGMNGFVLSERSMPYSIVVDSSGARYVNESTSYIDFGHAMLERDQQVPAIPSWVVMDVRARRRYLNTSLLNGRERHVANGTLVYADTLEELARKLGLDPDTFRDTVQRFNGFARTGKDLDFGRGDSAYDRYYSDPTVKPNPNLAPIERGPFSALRIVPGDLGTKGGLLTDEHARVLREDGSAIAGLYAAGNTTASVMGRTYPGPGSTIGPAAVFGWIGGQQAAGRRG
ncbi:FAD-dependent oxidoreductase [Promicromonospora sp. NPDC090134]|uniref:FAD-dependent oxidoreductase n=1 Tax=Promicromonospora sp. NPDC090134 TaxID=3364408 RepID=UPI00382C44B2